MPGVASGGQEARERKRADVGRGCLVVAMVLGLGELWALSRWLTVAVGIMAALYLPLLVYAWCGVLRGRK